MQINERVYILREAIARLAPMLSGKRMKVTMQGMQAYVEYDPQTLKPRRVNLPYLPDDASTDLCDALEGFHDHEVGHVLFSEGKDASDATKGGKQVKFIYNAIEDTRVEREMAREFPGCAFNIARLSNFAIKNLFEPPLKMAIAMGDTDKIIGCLLTPAIRALAGQPDFEHFMTPYWGYMEAFRKTVGEPLLSRIKGVSSGREAYELAKEICERFKMPESPEEERSKAEGGAGEASGAGKGEPGEEEGGATTGNLNAGMNHEQLSEAVDNGTEFDAGVAEAIAKRAMSEAKNSEYLVYTKDEDTLETMPTTSAGRNGISSMESEVDGMIGPMQKDVERMIAARSAAIWTGGHKTGRLHGAGLTRARFGHVDLFRRKQENRTKDVAVGMIVDISGSMRTNGKIRTAAYTAYGLAATLERLGIPNDVTAFTTGQFSHAVEKSMRADPMYSSYARYETLRNYVLKDFGERIDQDVKARFAELPVLNGVCRSNVDGESIMLLARRLAGRKETRKILMVLSDGRPAAAGHGDLDSHLKSTVEIITKAWGIEVVAIGIQDRSVQNFYPKSVVIKQVSELPAVVMGELKGMLAVQ